MEGEDSRNFSIRRFSVSCYNQPVVTRAPKGARHLPTPMPIQSKVFSPREAAKAMGVSYSTLKQWIYKGKIRTVKTAGGHHRVPEKQVDKFLYRGKQRKAVGERRQNFRRISGRNQLVGRVTEIKVSGLMAQVSLSIGGQHITSIITADAVREMRL